MTRKVSPLYVKPDQVRKTFGGLSLNSQFKVSLHFGQAPKNSGRIWFTDPRGEAHILVPRHGKHKDRSQWREVYYEPTPGRLILFPGWLTHEVEPNLNKEFKEDDRRGYRYSLSFNFIQNRKPGAKFKERKGHESGGGVFIDDLEVTDE